MVILFRNLNFSVAVVSMRNILR